MFEPTQNGDHSLSNIHLKILNNFKSTEFNLGGNIKALISRILKRIKCSNQHKIGIIFCEECPNRFKNVGQDRRHKKGHIEKVYFSYGKHTLARKG